MDAIQLVVIIYEGLYIPVLAGIFAMLLFLFLQQAKKVCHRYIVKKSGYVKVNVSESSRKEKI